MGKKILWSLSEEEKEQGFLKINNKVIASIVALATLEVKGVARLGKNHFNYLKAILTKKVYHQGVFLEFKEKDLFITINIVAEYGANLADLANEIQNKVRLALEKMAEITPTGINVIIQKVEKNR